MGMGVQERKVILEFWGLEGGEERDDAFLKV